MSHKLALKSVNYDYKIPMVYSHLNKCSKFGSMCMQIVDDKNSLRIELWETNISLVGI